MFSPSIFQEENGSSSDSDDDNANIEKTKILYLNLLLGIKNGNISSYGQKQNRYSGLYSIKTGHSEYSFTFNLFSDKRHQTYYVYRE